MQKIQETVAVATSGLARLFRFVIFVLTAGFAYPHVCTEDLEPPVPRQ